MPDVEGCQENKCGLTRTPYGRRFISEVCIILRRVFFFFFFNLASMLITTILLLNRRSWILILNFCLSSLLLEDRQLGLMYLWIDMICFMVMFSLPGKQEDLGYCKFCVSLSNDYVQYRCKLNFMWNGLCAANSLHLCL